MLGSSPSFVVCLLVLIVGGTRQLDARMMPSLISQFGTGSDQTIVGVVSVDHTRYSMNDTVHIEFSMKNMGSATVYMDRRMFWGGYGGGLKLEAVDGQGKAVPLQVFGDALMPPPNKDDVSLLIRLDRGYFYGTGLDLSVRENFPKPGKYSLRVVYKSWLRKEFVASTMRDLPVLWEDSPDIRSAPVWIEILP